jgi:hypothetical protein
VNTNKHPLSEIKSFRCFLVVSLGYLFSPVSCILLSYLFSLIYIVQGTVCLSSEIGCSIRIRSKKLKKSASILQNRYEKHFKYLIYSPGRLTKE